MDLPYITSLSLVWLVYTTLFADADKKVSDAFGRLKVAHSIHKDGPKQGMIDKAYLETVWYLGIVEMIDLGKPTSDNMIGVFAKRFADHERWQQWMMANLLILTFHTIAFGVLPLSIVSLTLPTHFILSLIAAGCFYTKNQLWRNLKFSQMILEPTSPKHERQVS